MKIILLYLCLLLPAPALLAQSLLFVRLYDTGGDKINKGYLFATTDSSLILYKGDAKVEVLAKQLGFIKSKHSLGHRIGRVALITVAVIAIIPGAILLWQLTRTDNTNYIKYPKSKNLNPDTKPPPRKLQKKYVVNGSLDEWRQQRILLEPFL